MTFFTQEEITKGFDYLIQKLIIRRNFSTSEEVLGILFPLALGLSRHELKRLTWREIYELDSDSNITIRNFLKIRGFDIYIPAEIRIILYQYYLNDSFPPPYQKFHVIIPDVDLRVQYGRKVLETCGYSDEVVKDLKVQFKMRQNAELFHFLGYNDKSDIRYSLEILDLDATQAPTAIVKDKNFNADYHFQSFRSFSRFLKLHQVDFSKRLESNIRIILLLSLYSGIRASKLLETKWEDMLIFNPLDSSISAKNKIVISEASVVVPSFLRRMILLNFEGMLMHTYFWESWDNPYLEEHNGFGDRIIKNEEDEFCFLVKKRPAIDLKKYAFTLESGNKISQPSLSREIKRGLASMGFIYCSQMKATSTLIMWGRRVLEIKGDHKQTIQILKKHFGFRTEIALAKYLYLYDSTNKKIEYKGQAFKNRFEAILYDVKF